MTTSHTSEVQQLSRREWVASIGATCGAIGLGSSRLSLGGLGAASFGTAGLAALTGCTGSTPSQVGQFVCTAPFVGDLVGHLARGLDTKVASLMGPGVDPHLYRPTASDVAQLMSSRAIFVVGLGLEGKMGETLARAAQSGRTLVVLGDAIPHDELFGAGAAAEEPQGGAAGAQAATHSAWDPHVWMDPALWSMCAQRGATGVIDSLGIAGTALASMVHTQAQLYEQRLAALRTWGIERAATIAPERRVIITSHDAFHYFGRAFGFEVFGIQGVSTESEAGLDDVRRLIDLIVERKIPAVFAESSVADKSVQALIEGAAARGHTVKLGGTLYADSLGERGTHEGTYLGMIDHDITTIVTALGGAIHPLGFDGSLSRPATA